MELHRLTAQGEFHSCFWQSDEFSDLDTRVARSCRERFHACEDQLFGRDLSHREIVTCFAVWHLPEFRMMAAMPGHPFKYRASSHTAAFGLMLWRGHGDGQLGTAVDQTLDGSTAFGSLEERSQPSLFKQQPGSGDGDRHSLFESRRVA